MPETTHQHTRELDIYYNEHRKACQLWKAVPRWHDGTLNYLADKALKVVLCDDCSSYFLKPLFAVYWMKPKYEEVLPAAKLWRYMDLNKFISLIGKKAIFSIIRIV